jgi:hyperosmotically inducible protein
MLDTLSAERRDAEQPSGAVTLMHGGRSDRAPAPRGDTVRTLSWLTLIAVLSGCNPYVAAISATYSVATSERSLSTQVTDTEIEAQIKASLLQSPVQGTGSLDVICRQGVVVLAGVVPPGSPAGSAAVRIARATPGVVRVETFFVASRPSMVSDLELKEKIKATFIADPNVVAGRVDVAVYAGHVVLVGVVANPEQAERFVDDARSVPGVWSVRSYLQVVQ